LGLDPHTEGREGTMNASTAKLRWPSVFHGAFGIVLFHEGHLKGRRPHHFGSRADEVALGPEGGRKAAEFRVPRLVALINQENFSLNSS
jgi:hypothetical protein